MTLNSVEYNEHLVIDWTSDKLLPTIKKELCINNKKRIYEGPVNPCGKIGEFIDALVETYKEDIQLQPDGVTIYLPLKPGTAKAMSVNDDGNMVWTELEAVTRHPPINKDGTSTLIKITTESGRSVIATKAKSFLTYKDSKIVPIEGSKLIVGDLMPIVNKTRSGEYRTTINLRSILNPKEVVFTDNMIIAKELILEANKTGSKTKWFHKIQHLVPYNRSDSLRVAIERALIHSGDENLANTDNKRSNRITGDKYLQMFEQGRIYSKSWAVGSGKVNSIPSIIELDREFGFLIGAYLAEGCVSKHQVGIANNNENYRNMATAWSRKQNISDRINSRINERGESTSICIHSTILRDFLVNICGRGSYEKRVPSFSYSAPDDFIKGILDGYISGDGFISENGNMVCSTRSKKLRDGITLLLARFQIKCKLTEHILYNKTSKEILGGENKPMYNIYTSVYEGSKLVDIITAIDYKHERLVDVANNPKSNDNRKLNTFNDVLLDPIISIEDYTSEHPYVYDLTVKDTKNMTSTNGICLRDKHVSLTEGGAVRKNPIEQLSVNN